MSELVDVVVIGMGPGGEEVAERLAEAGLRVAGVEKGLLGGECPYWGCIPSKMMIRAADALAEGRRVPGLAGASTVDADWAPVARRIREEATDGWDDRVAVDRFVGTGGVFVRGEGRISAPGEVTVDGRVLRASRGIVLNTGTSPAVPPIPGLSDVPYWTNHEAIEAETLPRSLAVLGGGAIGLELSQVFARFGVRVTVVEALDRLLSGEEPEAGAVVADVLREEGVELRIGAKAERVTREGDGVAVSLEGGERVVAERLLVATGRRTNLAGLGLEQVGVDAGARFVPVDDHLRVAPGVWALGDITGKGMFTHVSMYQARIVIADVLGKEGPGAEYGALPRVTFTDPEVGAAGVTEAAARESGIDVRTGSVPLGSTTRGWIHRGPGLIKLVADAGRDVLVGATVVAPSGGEVMSMLALAIHAAVPLPRLRHMIYAYPTFHRGIEAALTDMVGE